MNAYFIILDQAPIRRSKPVYQLCYGNYETATGYTIAESHTIKALVAKVKPIESVYRTYLQRTDGRVGFKLLRAGIPHHKEISNVLVQELQNQESVQGSSSEG